MSLTLAATDTITGVAGSATAITYTIFGDEVAAGVDAFKVLAQGQLPSSVGTLYTVPGSTQAIVKAIHLVNGTGGNVTARLNVKGTAAANAILPAITILAGGFATYADDGWRVYNDQGQLLGLGATGAAGTAGADGADGADGVGVPTGGDTGQVLTKDTAADFDTSWQDPTGGGSPLTVADEGTPLATDATTLDFVGAGVTASGTGATKTITISGSSVADILDLPTAETDAELVLAPDGAGGVEFRAEAGGPGGGGTPATNAAALVSAYSFFH